MSKVIGELFQQIFQSEEQIKQRFEAIKKVNQEIQEHQDKIRQLKYEADALQGNLTISTRKLLQEEIEEKWLQIREVILNEQKLESLLENTKLEEEIEKLESLEDLDRKKFLEDCDEFLSEFNMRDGSCELFKFEANMKEENKRLKHQQKELEKKVAVLETKKNELDAALEEYDGLLQTVRNGTERKTDLRNQLSRIKRNRESMTDEKETVARSIECNPEYQRLLKEVECSHKEQMNLQEEHQKLASELYKYQQSYMEAEHRRDQYSTRSQRRTVNNDTDKHQELFESKGNPWMASKSRIKTPSTPRVGGHCRKLFNYSGIKNKTKSELKDKKELSSNDHTVDVESLPPFDSFEFFDDDDIMKMDEAK